MGEGGEREKGRVGEWESGDSFTADSMFIKYIPIAIASAVGTQQCQSVTELASIKIVDASGYTFC